MQYSCRFLRPSLHVATALVLSSSVIGCGGSAMNDRQPLDAASGGPDSTGGAGGTGGANGGASGSSGTGGSVGAGGSAATGGGPGTGGSAATGGRQGSGGRSGVGGSLGTGGRPGTGGRSGAGGSLNVDAAVDASLDAALGRDAGGDARAFREVGSPIDGPVVGGACGAPTDPPCPEGTFCDFPDNRCATGVQGACAAIPRGVLCAISPAPVCGCDGQNYAGQCQAMQAGVDVSSTAACAPPTGTFRCGWTYCQHGTEYCSAQVGGVVSSPGSYTCNSLPAACNGAPSCGCVGSSSPSCSTSAQGDVTVTLAVP